MQTLNDLLVKPKHLHVIDKILTFKDIENNRVSTQPLLRLFREKPIFNRMKKEYRTRMLIDAHTLCHERQLSESFQKYNVYTILTMPITDLNTLLKKLNIDIYNDLIPFLEQYSSDMVSIETIRYGIDLGRMYVANNTMSTLNDKSGPIPLLEQPLTHLDIDDLMITMLNQQGVYTILELLNKQMSFITATCLLTPDDMNRIINEWSVKESAYVLHYPLLSDATVLKPAVADAELLFKDISELHFETRTRDTLYRNNIYQIGYVLDERRKTIKALRGIGSSALRDIDLSLEKWCRKHGFTPSSFKYFM